MSYIEGDLLTKELAPQKRDELHIHNKKLGELSNWLKAAYSESTKHFGVLYLGGPSGSGKSICVEVLCKELRIELIDYSPELLYDDFLEYEKPSSGQLIRFLKKRHISLNGGSKNRLLFVSELPDQSYNDPESFRAELSEALEYIRHPVVFCLSNNVGSWNLNPDRLFTTEFMARNYIDTIIFNPVADTFMKKAVVRAAKLLQSSLSTSKLNVIAEEARGDLRLAMNMLQMNTVGEDSSRKIGKKLVCAAKANKEDTFHMVGRILYAKRVNPNIPKFDPWTQKRRKSVPVPEPTERTDLEYDASDIIAVCNLSSDKLMDFLFEHEHVFCSNLSKYRQVMETLSFCDVLTSDWNVNRLSFPDEYASQISTRSVMWHNFQGPRPKNKYSFFCPSMKALQQTIGMAKNEIRRLPMIGDKYFTSLTAPYQSIIENIIDPRRIELFLSRPCQGEQSWKKGRDSMDENMDKMYMLHFKGRKDIRKTAAKRNLQKKIASQKEMKEEEEEEEKFTIEESSDDSFDDF